ncbi:FAD-binding domain-containing protein [Corynespora cassiicola Philippines]|uniref:FAD-binding domain-containing protein n=1 Tax=Corynespora cassiicola Philippines TaxID=1448308 RepID=A0A2T2NSP0_CORCC|nr:FAD-binding domain-containing protein [Corynespora cassiicola Philippines]
MLFTIHSLAAVAATVILPRLASAAPALVRNNGTCRALPGDVDWPQEKEWETLNRTVGGRLIRGIPLAEASCYSTNVSARSEGCVTVQREWANLAPFIADPVNIMAPYQHNNTCSPFLAANANATCTLGNMATYAINVSDAASAAAGVRFAHTHNLRLVVKNTGHDHLGRASGRGALALWTHNLKEKTLVDYRSSLYTGPALRLGAGVQVRELSEFAGANGLRAVGGSCPTVGAAGGYTQGGGHGPLSSAYGLGADNTLEFDVVTMDGQHRTVSPEQDADLYWALSGGGAGNWAVVLSVTVRAHRDGPVAGARFSFSREHVTPRIYWSAVEAWMKHVAKLNAIPGFRSMVRVTRSGFSLDMATLPDASVADMHAALAPFHNILARLNISLSTNETVQHPSYLAHYDDYGSNDGETRNMTIGNRLIPRDLVRDAEKLPPITEALRSIVDESPAGDPLLVLMSNNVSHIHNDNAVNPAWRSSLFLINMVLMSSEQAPWSKLQADLAEMNSWQDRLRLVTPGGGSYGSEATLDNQHWKSEYYGSVYDRLLQIKQRYDPDFVLWNQPAVGSDLYRLRDDGRLCTA